MKDKSFKHTVLAYLCLIAASTTINHDTCELILYVAGAVEGIAAIFWSWRGYHD